MPGTSTKAYVVLCCRPETVAVIAGMSALEQLALDPTVPYVPLPDVRARMHDTAADNAVHSCICCSTCANRCIRVLRYISIFTV